MKIKTAFAFFYDALIFRNMPADTTFTMCLHNLLWFLDDITHMGDIFLIY